MISQELSFIGYAKIKAAARELGGHIPDLLALARNNDPFFVGTPAQVKQAEWFVRVWTEFGFAKGTHLRRIHYRLVTREEPVLWVDDKPYKNTETFWYNLADASKFARHLGLVDPEAFEDHRNPEPHFFARYD